MEIISASQKNAVLENFREILALNVAEDDGYLLEVCKLKDSEDRVRNRLKQFKKVFENVLKEILKEDDSAKEVSTATYFKFSYSGDEMRFIDVVIRYSLGGEYVDKFRVGVSVDENMYGSLVYNLTEIFETILVDVLENINLSKINEAYKKATDEAGVDYTVSFVTELAGGKKNVFKITDTELVMVAHKDLFEEILTLEDLAEYKLSKEVEALKASQTPQLYMDKKTELYLLLTGLSKRSKVSVLIKKAYTKKIENVGTSTDLYANKLDGDVFSVVYVDKDGLQKEVLSPFNLETLLRV
jgi:hypothetical protein